MKIIKKVKQIATIIGTAKNNIIAFIGLIMMVIATYSSINMIKTDMWMFESITKNMLMAFLIFTSFLLLIFLCKNLYQLYKSKKIYGAYNLHSAITNLLITLIIIPVFIMSAYTWVFLDHGFQAVFNKNIKAAIMESVSVAEAYFDEHKNIIAQIALATANDLNTDSLIINSNPLLWGDIIETQAILRGLTEAIVFRQGQIIAKNSLSLSLVFESIPNEAMEMAKKGEIMILQGGNGNRMRALISLKNFPNTYLLIGKKIDSRVINHIKNTKNAALSYNALQQNIFNLKVSFFTLFSAVTLMLISASVIVCSALTEDFTRPIEQLSSMAKKISAGGELIMKSEAKPINIIELKTLYNAFDNMAMQLEKQHTQIVERKNFIESVLLEISSGVIAINNKMEIKLANKFAKNLLKLPDKKHLKIKEYFPELNEFICAAERQKKTFTEHQINIEDGEKKIVMELRINKYKYDNRKRYRYIITLNDITDRIAAQKSATWSEIIPRIAHEIKNPLTPINLAIIRIKKIYSNNMGEEKGLFLQYIETIEKQIRNINNTIGEFIHFTKSTTLKIEKINLISLINNIIDEYDIDQAIIFDKQDVHEMTIECDPSQMSKALINVIQNSQEAVKNTSNQTINITLNKAKKNIIIGIRDYGCGMPKNIIHKATEPYVTNKSKGSGLGLAIVKKIITEHDGQIEIKNKSVGTLVELILPYCNKEE